MSAPAIVIPYEKQSDSEINRGCGAACLSMVYRSFGKELAQAQIWPLIAKQNRFGSIASTTHLMALHAVNQGFSAVVVQARHPLQVLRLCREGGIRAILNHRIQPDVSAGHFSVLVDLDDSSVVLHDPFFGPARRMSHAELLRLWHPQSLNSEIVGNVVIGIASEPAAMPACEFCHTPIPVKVDCPRCRKAVGLKPAALLGCIRDGCIARMWNYVCCPSCDFVWSFNEAGTSTAEFPGAAAIPESGIPEPPSLDKVFAELDKFCAHISALPAAANHPHLKEQLDFMAASKQKAKLAQAEQLASLKASQDKVDAQKAAAKQKEEARQKKAEERNTPLPPLDGAALAEALLKNLGFNK
jgi:hypothetical protein